MTDHDKDAEQATVVICAAVQDLNDWKSEVQNGDTVLGFEEWLQHKEERDRGADGNIDPAYYVQKKLEKKTKPPCDACGTDMHLWDDPDLGVIWECACGRGHKKANRGCLEGMLCPKCGDLGPFKIAVTATGVALVGDDGVIEDNPSETNWEDDDYCHCTECDFTGTVEDFKTTEVVPDARGTPKGN